MSDPATTSSCDHGGSGSRRGAARRRRYIYMDGACSNNNVRDTSLRRAGCGVFVAPDDGTAPNALTSAEEEAWKNEWLQDDLDRANETAYRRERCTLQHLFPGEWVVYAGGVRVGRAPTYAAAVDTVARPAREAALAQHAAVRVWVAPLPAPPTPQRSRSHALLLASDTEKYPPSNNRAEVQAALTALEAWLDDECGFSFAPPARRSGGGERTLLMTAPALTVMLLTDSKLLYDSATTYLHGWLRNSFQTVSGSPVKNDDLYRRLDVLLRRVTANGWSVEWKHVSAHRNEPSFRSTTYADWYAWYGNHWADKLALLATQTDVAEQPHWSRPGTDGGAAADAAIKYETNDYWSRVETPPYCAGYVAPPTDTRDEDETPTAAGGKGFSSAVSAATAGRKRNYGAAQEASGSGGTRRRPEPEGDLSTSGGEEETAESYRRRRPVLQHEHSSYDGYAVREGDGQEAKQEREETPPTPPSLTGTTVVHIRRENGVIVQSCDCYIGRAWTCGGWTLRQSRYHNPFPLRKYTREESLRLYEQHIRSSPELMADLPMMRGKRLGCWCKPLPCHGDVLVRLVDEQKAEEDRRASADAQQNVPSSLET